MRKCLRYTAILFIIAFVMSGCTHKIEISPNMDEINSKVLVAKDYNVAYYIDSSKQNLYVVTSGGGGDKVGYTPYSDTETVFRSVLLKKFKKVYKIDSLDNNDFINEKKIRFIFTYNLVTDSSSSSAFTWPPTKFTISLSCKAVDKDGTNIWNEEVYEEGTSTFSEFKQDFSLSARRASEQVFIKVLEKLKNSKEFN